MNGIFRNINDSESLVEYMQWFCESNEIEKIERDSLLDQHSLLQKSGNF